MEDEEGNGMLLKPCAELGKTYGLGAFEWEKEQQR
jgi:hypothetical protein